MEQRLRACVHPPVSAVGWPFPSSFWGPARGACRRSEAPLRRTRVLRGTGVLWKTPAGLVVVAAGPLRKACCCMLLSMIGSWLFVLL